MGVIGGALADGILRRYAPPADDGQSSGVGEGRARRLAALLGDDIFERTRARQVLDFGCGNGTDAVVLARSGAARVVGLDVVEASLQRARRLAEAAGVADRCVFTTTWTEPVDLILSVDAFEHFADPAAILDTMATLLDGGDGRVLVSFGPTWLHPLGGHLFSVFPWAHLLFTESALLRWRRRFRDDGARRFHEVEGGLNRMRIRHFETLVSRSRLRLEAMETVPIASLRWLHGAWSREFTTSIVRARLALR